MNLKYIFYFLLLQFFANVAQGLRCVKCEDAASNHGCNLNGLIETCGHDQLSCFTKISHHGGVYTINKGCIQKDSCQAQNFQNNWPIHPRFFTGVSKNSTYRCNGGYHYSVCHYCCNYQYCNLKDVPVERPDSSCTELFPLCRNVEWTQRNGLFNPPSFGGCYCDSQCVPRGDCCKDYHSVCVGVLPREMRLLDNYGGAGGGEYDINVPKGGGLPHLRCVTCENADDHESCNQKGRIVECEPNQRSCITEVRYRNGRESITKRCEQVHTCWVLEKQSKSHCNETPSDDKPCFSCCDFDYCNLLKTPPRSSNSSCLTQFPGFPHCLKASLATCDSRENKNKFCSGEGCRCDVNCAAFNDCCDDYDQVCLGPPPTNLDWIFDEIAENPNTRKEIDTPNSVMIGEETVVEGSSPDRALVSKIERFAKKIPYDKLEEDVRDPTRLKSIPKPVSEF